MASSIPFQFARSKYFLDNLPLVVRKSLAFSSPMCFITNFERKPEILRGLAIQFQPSTGELLTGSSYTSSGMR